MIRHSNKLRSGWPGSARGSGTRPTASPEIENSNPMRLAPSPTGDHRPTPERDQPQSLAPSMPPLISFQKYLEPPAGASHLKGGNPARGVWSLRGKWPKSSEPVEGHWEGARMRVARRAGKAGIMPLAPESSVCRVMRGMWDGWIGALARRGDVGPVGSVTTS
jgi:hypothetical protein